MLTLKQRSDTLMLTVKITGELQQNWDGFLTQLCPNSRYLLEM